MKTKGSVNYTRRELKTIKTMLAENAKREKPFSIQRLSILTSKLLNRPQVGVYYKMLGMSPKRTRRTMRTPVTTPKLSVTKSVSFGKPSKIEISETGMTFYF
jgi:hypothetical protein